MGKEIVSIIWIVVMIFLVSGITGLYLGSMKKSGETTTTTSTIITTTTIIDCEGVLLDICDSFRLKCISPQVECVYESTKFCGPEIPEVCIQVWEPVIGSDGEIYSNSCMACSNPEVIYYTPLDTLSD